MSWASLQANQPVSYDNLRDAVNTGVFMIRPGQTIPAGNRCLKCSEAGTYTMTQNVAGGNKLVLKSQLIAEVIYTAVTGCYVAAASSYQNACAVFGSTTLYSVTVGSTFNVGQTVYKANGDGTYSPLTSSSGFEFNYISFVESSLRIWVKVSATTGVVLEKGQCDRRNNGVHVIRTGSRTFSAEAQYPVATDIIVRVRLKLYNITDIQFVDAIIPWDSTSGIGTANAEIQEIMGIVAISPSSDAVYNYIIIN